MNEQIENKTRAGKISSSFNLSLYTKIKIKITKDNTLSKPKKILAIITPYLSTLGLSFGSNLNINFPNRYIALSLENGNSILSNLDHCPG